MGENSETVTIENINPLFYISYNINIYWPVQNLYKLLISIATQKTSNKYFLYLIYGILKKNKKKLTSDKEEWF